MMMLLLLLLLVFFNVIDYCMSSKDIEVTGKYIMLDKDDSTIDDPNNLVISWRFRTSEIYEYQSFIKSCKHLCDQAPEFLKFFAEAQPCEFVLANNVIDYTLKKRDIQDDIDRDKLYKTMNFLRNKKSQDTSTIFSSSSSSNNNNNKDMNSRTCPVRTKTTSPTTKYSIDDNQGMTHVAIVVPVTSKGHDTDKGIAKLPLFSYLIPGLQNTTTRFDNIKVHLYLGYDECDVVYDSDALVDIIDAINYFLPDVIVQHVRLVGLTGKIVHIWNELTSRAYLDGIDYFFLLGDDVVITTTEWAPRAINILQGNPILSNFGTVAFHDLSNPDFPTFPVFHRTHLDIFGHSNAFDPFFENTFADPWLSDVYVKFNSSFIPNTIVLKNMIGGFEQARYNPKHPNMENYIDLVQRTRRTIAAWLSNTLTSKSFKWSLSDLSYGDEGIFFREYCLAKPGCQVITVKKEYDDFQSKLSRKVPFSKTKGFQG